MAEVGGGDQSFRIVRTIRPLSSRVIFGLPDEPLVVENDWSGRGMERTRVINPERSYQVPTFVFWDETTTSVQQHIIEEAFSELFGELGFDRKLINYLGNWRDAGYRDVSGKLVPHKSIEWQLTSKWNARRKQINAEDFLSTMFFDPYQKSTPHWEVVFTNKDLYTTGTNFVLGGHKVIWVQSFL